MKLPYREKVHGCIHPETYKYFFPKDRIESLWKELSRTYGPILRSQNTGVMEIRSQNLLIRSTLGGNPVTVIRKRDCTEREIFDLHRSMGFMSESSATMHDAFPDALMTLDRDRNVISVSDRCSSLFGKTAKIVGVPFEALLDPRDRRSALSLHRALAAGLDLGFDSELTLCVGTVRKRCRVRIVNVEEGYLAVLEERPLEKEDDGHLKKVEARWRALVAFSGDGILIIDTAGLVQDTNKGGIEVLRPMHEHAVLMNEESLKGKQIFSFLNDSAGDKLRVAMAKIAANTETSAIFRERQGPGILEFRISALEPRPNVVLGYCLLIRDITEQCRVDAMLEKSEERLRLALLAGNMGTFDWNIGTNRIYCSRKFSDLLDFADDVVEVNSESFFQGIFREDRDAIVEAFRSHSGPLRRLEVQFRVMAQSGKMRWIQLVGLCHMDASQKPSRWVGVVVEITERKNMEQLVIEQQQKIVSSAKLSALGEMAGGVAHEINNPLAIIRGMSERLHKFATKGPVDAELAAKVADKITLTVLRIAKIIKGLRAFARDCDDDPFELASVKGILEDTLELCCQEFAYAGIEITVEGLMPDMAIQCRSAQICQVILNLLNNAKHAVETLPEKWVKIVVRDAGTNVEISVSDSGKGIAPELSEKIMLPFFTTKELGKGTGLGLSVSKGIVSSHGGELRLDPLCSNTRFVVILPKKQANGPDEHREVA